MSARARPLVGLSVIVMDVGRKSVLMGKRKGAHGAGTMSFPGGHLEWLEQFHDCAKRELREEVGWKAGRNYTLIDSNPSAVTDDVHFPEGKHYITLFFKALHLEGRAKNIEPEKCGGWRWYEWEKLPKMNLFLPVQNLLKQEYNPFESLTYA